MEVAKLAGKREQPGDIVSKLRQGQGKSVQSDYRSRKEYGAMSRDQLNRLKELEAENQRLRRAVSDLTLDKLILIEGARGNF